MYDLGFWFDPREEGVHFTLQYLLTWVHNMTLFEQVMYIVHIEGLLLKIR